MDTQNSVAVIIAVYNAEKTIGRAIQSALSEECVKEVFVIDDCSTDNTVAEVEKINDHSDRIKIFKQTHNQGPSAARNVALDNCTASWITILDSDDFFEAGRLDNMLKLGKGYDIIADDMFQVSENDIDGERQNLMQPPLTESQKISLLDFVYSNVTKSGRTRAELGFIKPLITMSLLNDYKLRYQEHMRLGEDYELYTRLLANGAQMILLPAQGYVSVRRENSLSGQHSIEDLKHLRDCNSAILEDLELEPKARKAIGAHYKSIDCRYQWRVLIEAVKDRDIKACAKCFFRPWPVQLYLIGQLFEQVVVRTMHKLKKS